jgi:hypothetical protein
MNSRFQIIEWNIECQLLWLNKLMHHRWDHDYPMCPNIWEYDEYRCLRRATTTMRIKNFVCLFVCLSKIQRHWFFLVNKSNVHVLSVSFSQGVPLQITFSSETEKSFPSRVRPKNRSHFIPMIIFYIFIYNISKLSWISQNLVMSFRWLPLHCFMMNFSRVPNNT